MTTRDYTLTPDLDLKGAAKNSHLLQAIWTGLLLGDDGAPLEAGGFADRTAQITGTFGTATVTIEGSNDGVTWFTLLDPQGNAISKAAAALEAVLEATRYIRPKVTGGDGTTNLVVNLFARG